MADDQARYDHEGYSRDDRGRNSQSLYELTDFEKKNIREIAQMISRGKYGEDEIETCLTCIEKMEMKINEVLATEQKQGLSNTEIQVELGNIRKIKSELISIITKLRRGSQQ